MNYLLSINKKYILIVSLSIFSIFFIFIFYKYFDSFNDQNPFENKIELLNVDIAEPRFAINNIEEKIFISAKEGNFIEDNKILLRKSVKFKSNDFSIESDNVTFDREKQTAHSNDKSTFKSKNTTILSEGFDIYDNGNKIDFYGKARIILKWRTSF